MSKYENFVVNLANPESTHTKIVGLVGQGKKVLDVGCATGYIAEVLVSKFGCEVTGIEIDQEAADIASRWCKEVLVGDVESLDLSAKFAQGDFDVVILADVLEHLREPASVIKKLLPLCKGEFIISIPNMSHASIVYELLGGKFDYRELGLLDNTHIRFFTRESMSRLLTESGLKIESVLRTKIPPEKTEFNTDLSRFPAHVVEYVNSLAESDTYQYIFVARPIAVQDQNYVEQMHCELVKARTTSTELTQEINLLKHQLAELELDRKKAEALLTERAQQINFEREQASWYAKKLKESLQSFYVQVEKEKELREITSERDGYFSQYKERCEAYEDLLSRYNELGTEITRLRKFAPDRLPKVLNFPIKAVITTVADGPLEPLRLYRKKKS